MLQNIFMISLSMSVVILILLIISPFLNKRYSAKWKYFLWLILALRLVIPFRIEMPKAPVNIPVTGRTVVLRTQGVPFQIIDDSYIEISTDYARFITLNDLIYILWAVGALSFFLYHIISYIIFKRRIEPYCTELDIEMPKKINVSECSKITSPMMIGFIKPVILLPCMDYTDEELNVVLKHELTHYKRHDIWYKLLLIIANSVHFFNPLVYFMVKQANRDLEYSCDDLVILGENMDYKKNYSLTILKSMKKSEQTTLSTYLNGGSDND